MTRRDARLAAAGPGEIMLCFDHNLVNRLALLQVLDRAAFHAPHRDALGPFLGDGPLAGLGPALARHREQFPAAADELAGTERRALAAAAAGACDFAAIYRAVTAEDDPPWLGDTVLRPPLWVGR